MKFWVFGEIWLRTLGGVGHSVVEYVKYDKACSPNILTYADWEILERTHRFLQVFNSGTLWIKGDRVGLS